jgi:DNA-binding HxlR family transcriptional regulator
MNGPRSRRPRPCRDGSIVGAMRGYGQYCPIALAAEVFAQRWTPIIIRNLHLGCTHFGDILDGAPGLPRSVLSQRLRALERDGVVVRTTSGHATRYELTEMGAGLSEICLALGAWGARWREVQPADQSPYLALWTTSRLIDPASLPQPRVVVRFDVRPLRPSRRFWLLLGSAGNEVCVEAPGFAEDGVVTTDVTSLVRWSAGEVSLASARADGGMAVAAPPWLERELARWGRLSPFAGARPARPEIAVPVGGRRGGEGDEDRREARGLPSPRGSPG